MLGVVFRTCPKCNGYGVRDSGWNCSDCGGKGRAGTFGGTIGSGELMLDELSGKRITPAEFNRRVKLAAAQKRKRQGTFF